MSKSVYDLLNERFGVRTYANENPEQLQLGATAEIILRANPNRLAFVVFNLSANTVFLRPGGVPSATSGIALTAGTGSLSVGMEEDYSLPAVEWQGVAGGAASDVFILEILTTPT